ncbi:putative transposase [Deinococcus sp. UYEF24]
MIYPFVHTQRPQFPLRVLCRTMGVTESGYHSWRVSGQAWSSALFCPRRPQNRAEDDAQLLAHIETVHDDSKGRYSSPRVYRELRATGVCCSRHRVARLMQAAGHRGRGKRRSKSTTDSGHALPVAENLLMQQFEVTEPNLVWAADMTFIRTTEGWLYLAVVLDLYSRKIVGWSMGSRMTAELPLCALRMAFHQWHPAPGLMHYSDRGSQYAGKVYQHALEGMQMTCSMSRKGDCWDNAVVESFFASLKREECNKAAYPTRDLARQHVFAYLEQLYNRKRRHSYLGYVSPAEFEAQHPASLKRIA